MTGKNEHTGFEKRMKETSQISQCIRIRLYGHGWKKT